MCDNQQPQPCEGHLVKCARCSKKPGIEPGCAFEPCTTCKGVGHVLLK
ncbi:hypothetical protein [Nonomuraea sp. NPDC050643]